MADSLSVHRIYTTSWDANMRGIRLEAVQAALRYGRRIWRHGAVVRVIGRKEVRRWGVWGVNLSNYVNLQVVVAGDGEVITTYRHPKLRHLR